MGVEVIMIPYLRTKNLTNDQPYPTAHVNIAHIAEPSPGCAIIKLLPIRHDMLVSRVQVRKATKICKSRKVNMNRKSYERGCIS